jgi:AbrB family looped-hinge helix DNA binding protein
MAGTIVVDRNGRVYLPKFIRRLLRLEPNSIMEVAVMDDQVILKRVDSVVEQGRGMFRGSKNVPVQKALQTSRRRYNLP